jgi:hypothetical protein
MAAAVPPYGPSRVPPCQLLPETAAAKRPELLVNGDIPERRPVTVLPVIVADPLGAG